MIKNKSYIMLELPAIKPLPSKDRSLPESKETTLERADFTLQQLMFVTAEKERRLFIIFFLSSHFLSTVVPAILS